MLNLFTGKPGLKVVFTVGNSDRSDDGAGPYIASQIKPSQNLEVINALGSPENFVDKIISLSPASILIIDAADFGGRPGEAKIIKKENIPEASLSTHSIPLRVIAHILAFETKAKVKFLGIQPKSVAFGSEISEEVKKTAREIIQLINQVQEKNNA